MHKSFLSIKRSVVALVIILLGILLFVAGCNSDEPETPEPTVVVQPEQAAPSPAEDAEGQADEAAVGVGSQSLEGTVVLWHSWAGIEADALNEVLGRTLADHPGLRIETLFVAYSDLEQSYVDAVQSGAGPDLLLAPNWWLPTLVQRESVAPLVNLVSDEELARYWPATIENLTAKNSRYGIPATFELVTLFFNQSLISREAIPTTTDGLLSLMQSDASPGLGFYNSLYHLYWGLPAFGSRLLDDNGKAILDQGNGAADYLSWLIQLDEAQRVYIDSDYGMVLDRFKKGEFALFVDGPWSIPELTGAFGDQLQVALLPAGPAGPARPWLTTEGLFVNAKRTEESQQLAARVALELTDGESGLLYLQIARLLPAARGIQGADALLNGFMQQAEQAESMPSRPETEQALSYGGDMLIKSLNGVADPQETVAETTALINDATGQ